MDLSAFVDQAARSAQAAQLPSLEKLGHLSPGKAREAAVEFEGFFVAMVLENMFAGIETEGLFGGGHGEKVFRSMLLQEYGKSIAQQSGIGLADAVQREILKLQEAQADDSK